MSITTRELWYTSAVTEAPQEFTFHLPFDWFVLTAFLDEEDHGPLALPYQGRVEVELRRRVGAGLLGRKEIVGSVDVTSGQAGHILVRSEDYSMFGEYTVTIRYVGPALTGDFPFFVQAFGEGLKILEAQADGFEQCASLACYAKFSEPLATPVDLTVREYLPDSARLGFSGTPTTIEVGSVTIPAGETAGRVVIDKAFGWRYEASVSGGSNPQIMWAGLPL